MPNHCLSLLHERVFFVCVVWFGVFLVYFDFGLVFLFVWDFLVVLFFVCFLLFYIWDTLHKIASIKKKLKSTEYFRLTKYKRANFNIVPDQWTYLSLYFFSADKLCVGLPPGQHLYSGLWRYVSRNSPWAPVCFPLHCFWDNPEWHAHLHPLQQILRLLQQAEGLRVHSSQEGKREGGFHTESHEENIWVLWRRCFPPFVTAVKLCALDIGGQPRSWRRKGIKSAKKPKSAKR